MTLNFDQTLRREARQCFAYRRLTQRELFLQGRDIKSCARFKATTDQLRAQEVIGRSEEHTSELQSLMRISYAVFCLKKKKISKKYRTHNTNTDHVIHQSN